MSMRLHFLVISLAEAFYPYEQKNILSQKCRGFGNRPKRGTGEQRPNFEVNRGAKTILGNREHKKFLIGNRGTSQFIPREQVPLTLGGPHNTMSKST